LLLAIPIVWLWLRKPSLPRETVATDALWHEALAVERLRAGWQRWRRGASLAVRLLILLLFVLALADPRTRPPQRLVLVLDNSAGTDAADAAPSRLAAAKQAARDIINSLGDDDRAAIVTAGGPAAVRCVLTAEQPMLRDALENLPAGSGPAETEAAADLAGRLLPDDTDGRVVALDGDPSGFVDRAGLPIWLCLTLAAAVLLVLEWCLFQRRWIC
jgi:Ca-activated chloride channel family protein